MDDGTTHLSARRRALQAKRARAERRGARGERVAAAAADISSREKWRLPTRRLTCAEPRVPRSDDARSDGAPPSTIQVARESRIARSIFTDRESRALDRQRLVQPRAGEIFVTRPALLLPKADGWIVLQIAAIRTRASAEHGSRGPPPRRPGSSRGSGAAREPFAKDRRRDRPRAFPRPRDGARAFAPFDATPRRGVRVGARPAAGVRVRARARQGGAGHAQDRLRDHRAAHRQVRGGGVGRRAAQAHDEPRRVGSGGGRAARAFFTTSPRSGRRASPSLCRDRNKIADIEHKVDLRTSSRRTTGTGADAFRGPGDGEILTPRHGRVRQWFAAQRDALAGRGPRESHPPPRDGVLHEAGAFVPLLAGAIAVSKSRRPRTGTSS